MTELFLSKSFDFEAAHFLPHVADDHKCRRVHGHSFRCELQLKGPLDPKMGWVMDYAEVKEKYQGVYDQLDHRFLNENPELNNPTSENIAIWIWDQLKPNLPELHSVKINETCNSACVYFGPTP